jgi:hypothetical protein
VTSLLDANPTTPEGEAKELAIHDDQNPRPGVWAGESGADLRLLTQEETDLLIRSELIIMAGVHDQETIAMACGYSTVGDVKAVAVGSRIAYRQRGGIDSDPLVRLLAHRAWGDRDRQWFELRGVRTGDKVAHVRPTYNTGEFHIARSWHPVEEVGHALADARPGEIVQARIDTSRLGHRMTVDGREVIMQGVVNVQCRVSDRLRDLTAWNASFDRSAAMDMAYMMGTVRPPAPRPVVYSPESYRILIGGGVSVAIARGDCATPDRRAVIIDDPHDDLVGAMVHAHAHRWAERERVDVRSIRAIPMAPRPATFLPGERRPGTKPAPPTPPWARKRRVSRHDNGNGRKR